MGGIYNPDGKRTGQLNPSRSESGEGHNKSHKWLFLKCINSKSNTSVNAGLPMSGTRELVTNGMEKAEVNAFFPWSLQVKPAFSSPMFSRPEGKSGADLCGGESG